jgi:hypothetical protein
MSKLAGNKRIVKNFRDEMLTIQKELYVIAGAAHKALHEPQAALAYTQHLVWIGRQTFDRQVQTAAYGTLAKAHLSRAAKSKPLSWQEKRDEEFARGYYGKFKVCLEPTPRRV